MQPSVFVLLLFIYFCLCRQQKRLVSLNLVSHLTRKFQARLNVCLISMIKKWVNFNTAREGGGGGPFRVTPFTTV